MCLSTNKINQTVFRDTIGLKTQCTCFTEIEISAAS